MKKSKIIVNESAYDVLVGENIFPNLSNEIKKRKFHNNILVVCDKSVYKYHKELIDDFLSYSNFNIKIIKLNINEENKSLLTVQKIYDFLLKNHFGRDTLLVAIGGGIIGDVAGFAASTFMRGIQLVHIPTTLLSAVDSSIGGKTGVNYSSAKNIIGAFYQPNFVLCDINFLNTLPKSEFICGMGEIAKYSFLMPEKIYNNFCNNFDKLITLNKNEIEKIIYESIKFKGCIVAQDARESGIREILNLGHTFAHAIEVEQEHAVKHGEAVVIGLASALFLSLKMNFVDDRKFNEYLTVVKKFDKLVKVGNYSAKKIYKVMSSDKKNRRNIMRFVLIKDIGEILLGVEADKNLVIDSIKYGMEFFKR